MAAATVIVLTDPQRAALEAIKGRTHGRTAAAVAAALGHSSPSRAAQVLDRLVELGVARTWRGPDDRRRWSAPPGGPTLADTLNDPDDTHAVPEREA